LEPSRTQLVPQTEYFGSGWTLSNITANYNNSTSPEGLQNATNLVPNTSNSGHRMYLSFTASGDVTASIYVKPNGYSKIGIQNNVPGGGQYFTFDIDTLSKLDGNETDYGHETAANGFIHLWVVMPAGTTQFGYFLYVLNDSYTTGNPGIYSFTGDGTSGILAYGLQAEQGGYPTSYIPNHSGGTITRGAELLLLDSASSYRFQGLGDGESGTIVLKTKQMTDEGSRFNFIGTGGSGNWSWIGTAIYIRTSSGYVIFNGAPNHSSFLGSNVAIGVRKNLNNLSVFVNGSLIETKDIGTDSITWANAITYYQNAQLVNQFLEFDTSLSDADCINITSL
jgi:hypothetical protein